MRDVADGMESARGRSDLLAGLVGSVIHRLATQRQVGAVPAPDPAVVQALLRAVTAPAGSAAHGARPQCGAVWAQALRARLQAARATDLQLLETAVPAVARHLGEAWIDERMSFSEVTIASARLHDLLRAVSVSEPRHAQPGAPSVLVLVPAGEQHTLGASVLAGTLRRRGIAAVLKIAPSMGELALLLSRQRFRAALVSMGCTDRVEPGIKLIKSLRILGNRQLSIAAGGAASSRIRDILSAAGADLVTDDMTTLIAFLDLQADAAPALPLAWQGFAASRHG